MTVNIDIDMEVVGWFGMSLLVLAYLLVSMEWIKPGYMYQAINIVGAACVGASALVKEAYPASALEGAWIVIAVIAIALRTFRKPQPK